MEARSDGRGVCAGGNYGRLVSPLIGLLLDRSSPRRIILPAIVLFALGLALLSTLNGHLWQFYLTFFVLGPAANGTAQFAYTRTLLTWFVKRRGFAMALLLTGSGIGSVVIPPLTQWMIHRHGWRAAWLMLGGIALLGLPLTARLVRNRPETHSLPTAPKIAGVSVASAVRTAAFWILAFITMLSAFSENGLVTNLAAILTQHGVPSSSAAIALSLRGGAGIVGRLCIGFAIDRVSPMRMQTFVLTLAALGTLIFAFAGSGSLAWIAAIVLGVGLGSEADVMPCLMARFFGPRHFSVLYGSMWTAYAIGGATGPLWIGHRYDHAGGVYQPKTIVCLFAVALGAAALSLFLSSHPTPRNRTAESM